MIEVKNATLQYTTFKRSQGLKGVMHDFFKRSVIQVEALSDISLTINEGEMIGLIGRNGAGKTTLIKLLTGILPLRQGEIKIDQMLPYQREKVFLKNIGVLLGQRSQLIWDLPAIDTYDMLAAIYELPKQMYNARLTWLSEQLEVTELLYIPVRKLSLGQRVKCELIAALLHRPKYLFLDEPTLGLDFVTQKTIYKILRLENQYHKTTIITTSHYIKDIEQLADKVIILNKGKIIFKSRGKVIKVELEQICYVESHCSNTHAAVLWLMDKRPLQVPKNLRILEKENPRLWRSHQSYLLNPGNVYMLDKLNATAAFVNGLKCPISRQKFKTLAERFA